MPHRPLEDLEPAELAHLCADPVFGLVCRYCGRSSAESQVAEKSAIGTKFDIEDPDTRPYIWDLPEEGCKCR